MGTRRPPRGGGVVWVSGVVWGGGVGAERVIWSGVVPTPEAQIKLMTLLRGLGAGGGGAPAPSGAAARPGSQPPAPGSSALPPGRLGVVIPLGADLASRLRAGDLVDVYALGSKSALTRGAYVVDVTRPADDSMALGYAGSGGGAGGAGAAVFLAIDPADASRISAGQSTGSGSDGFLLALSPRSAVAAGAGASPS